ncbi:outer membrane beta-barrel domain protein [Orientia chuto str. Dubai]|uniref:56 kDa type-specific antigen n=2 Tax=Candidatus Orientia mediorientalis TaxID=911112 RepID=A0A0F3MLD9_9RICK|nr:type-specific antigen TSA56 [Candidatus Orientia mediorientalis]KJV56563.1 outer membrane beta-barrel domain protein [Orientia chuto str. Dubai]
MKKIMLIASAMSALSLPFSANAMEFGELECGPYARLGITGGMLGSVESSTSSADKKISLSTSYPFGATVGAGMTIAPGFRVELNGMYLMNVTGKVEASGSKGNADSGDANVGATIIHKRKKLTPPQPVVMPISTDDRNRAIDIIRQVGAQVPAQERINWLRDYAGIQYMVQDPNNPQGPQILNPMLRQIVRGNPHAVPRAAAQDFDINDHEQWRNLVTGIALSLDANKSGISSIQVLNTQLSKIYSDIRIFAKTAGIEQVSYNNLPNSATSQQIQEAMQQVETLLEEIRESFDGFMVNAFDQRIQLGFVMPAAPAAAAGQPQPQAPTPEAVACAAVRALNGSQSLKDLYRDLNKLRRHAGIKKAMDQLADQEDDQSGGGDKPLVAPCSKAGGSEEKGGKDSKEEPEFDLSMIVGQIKGYADIITTESMSVYAGLGAGIAHTFGKVNGKDITTGKTGMVVSGAVGVAVNIAEGVSADIEAGYMHCFNKVEDKYQLGAYMASATIRYSF